MVVQLQSLISAFAGASCPQKVLETTSFAVELAIVHLIPEDPYHYTLTSKPSTLNPKPSPECTSTGLPLGPKFKGFWGSADLGSWLEKEALLK